MSLLAYEWCAFDGDLPGAQRGTGTGTGTDAGTDAGAGTAAALQVAPARWLLLRPDAAWLAELSGAEQAGRGALTDVTGRWVPVMLPGSASTKCADHPLNAAVPLALVLRDRGAALLWAFDCPLLLMRSGDRIEVLVEASYAHSFRAQLAGL